MKRKPTTTGTHALDEFSSQFQQELQRLLRGRGRYKTWQIDEICQEEMVTLLRPSSQDPGVPQRRRALRPGPRNACRG